MDEFEPWMRREEKLLQLQTEQDPHDKMYVYWLEDGIKIKPALLCGVPPLSNLFEYLQENYGQQSYCVMIRRKKTMILTLEVHIGVPLVHFPARDIRTEIETLRQRKSLR